VLLYTHTHIPPSPNHMAPSPRTQRKKKSRTLRGRNSVRKQLTFSGKKTSPKRSRPSYKVHSNKAQNLLARLEAIVMEN